jgi:dTDP-glucose 4,6-dehydratase
MPTILVTGGLGFIGAAYVNHLCATRDGWTVAILDAQFYAAHRGRLAPQARRSVRFIQCTLASWSRILDELQRLDVLEVVHFAANSHVSTSFLNPLEFTTDNLLGTHTLLECCRLYGKLGRIVVVSTDEVYGDSPPDAAPLTEDSALRPNNPYAASKAAADLMAQTYAKCYHLPIVITRSNNVIGPLQHSEKLVPAVMARIRAGQRALVEGDGTQLRAFVYVDDVVAAIDLVRTRGQLGQVYNIAGACEHSVLGLVEAVLAELRPGERLQDWTEFVPDRLYQDKRYFVSAAKLHALGWKPQVSLPEAIARIAQANLHTEPSVTGDSDVTW